MQQSRIAKSSNERNHMTCKWWSVLNFTDKSEVYVGISLWRAAENLDPGTHYGNGSTREQAIERCKRSIDDMVFLQQNFTKKKRKAAT